MPDQSYHYVVIQVFDDHAIGDKLTDVPAEVLAERVGSHLIRVAAPPAPPVEG
jgi:hypothetical protein